MFVDAERTINITNRKRKTEMPINFYSQYIKIKLHFKHISYIFTEQQLLILKIMMMSFCKGKYIGELVRKRFELSRRELLKK